MGMSCEVKQWINNWDDLVIYFKSEVVIAIISTRVVFAFPVVRVIKLESCNCLLALWRIV